MTAGGKREGRRGAERKGRRAEYLAALAYMSRGFQVIARRFRTPLGEIDLVAKRGDLLVFAEVKARARDDDAVEAVSARARRRIEGAARTFLAHRPDLANAGVRFDIAAARGWRVRILADAWREGD